MVQLQVPPEQLAELPGQAPHGGVVDGGLALAQVVHQQVPDAAALDAVPVDHLLDAALSRGAEDPHGGGDGDRETLIACSTW